METNLNTTETYTENNINCKIGHVVGDILPKLESFLGVLIPELKPNHPLSYIRLNKTPKLE